jgi:hypothetical protein
LRAEPCRNGELAVPDPTAEQGDSIAIHDKIVDKQNIFLILQRPSPPNVGFSYGVVVPKVSMFLPQLLGRAVSWPECSLSVGPAIDFVALLGMRETSYLHT